MALVGSDLQGHLVPIPRCGQSCCPPAQAAQSPSNLALSTSRDGAPTALGQPDLGSEGAGEHPPHCRCSSGNVGPETSPQEAMLTPSLLLFAQVAERALGFIRETTEINPTKPTVENNWDFIPCYSGCQWDLK